MTGRRPRSSLRRRRGLVWLAALALLLVASPADAGRRRKRKKKKKPPAAEPAPPAPAPAPTPDPPADDASAEAGDPGAAPGAGQAGGAAPTPAPPPPPAPEPREPEPAAVDVDSLRQEYLKLRDELFESRARAATAASALYSTRIQVRLTFTSGRFYGVTRAAIRLDGAGVFDDTSGAIATDDAVRFDGWIAPGRHVLTFRVETVGKDDDRFTSATETTLVVQAVAGKDLTVAARAGDEGDIAYEWKRKQKGTYRLGVDVDVKTQDRAAPADKKAARAPRAAPRGSEARVAEQPGAR